MKRNLMKTIAILGKPNVGKSSLFNRLIKQNLAITSHISGTTRDIKKSRCCISGVDVEIIDTGGLEKGKKGLFAQVSKHSQNAATIADMILYMVDGSISVQDDDIAYFRALQKHKKPLLLVLNKIDNDLLKQNAWDFRAFGTDDMHFISVSHNRGITLLLEDIFRQLSLHEEQSLADSVRLSLEETDIDESLESFLNALESPQQEADEVISVGIIGRVNVGKSSLLNALLGTERSVVSEIAGTTIDPVDDEIEIDGRNIKFIDTAGIRKAGKIEGIEKYALLRTQAILSQSHIAILVLDASEPFVELDEKISSLIPKYELGVIIVWNKWDKKMHDFAQIKADFMRRFPFLTFAPVITLSALNGRNIHKLKSTIIQVYERFCYRIPTATLNDVIAKAVHNHHIPSDHGKIVKIYYATQYDIKPPKIALISNRPNSLHFSYKRYIVNVLREHFDFTGVPIFVSAKAKNASIIEKEKGKENKHKRHQRGDKNTRF